MRSLSFILPFLVLVRVAVAGDLGRGLQDFDEGNLRFRNGDYHGALAAYDRVLAEGYESGVLYYNMGNAFFRTDEIGQAIRFYEKARRLMPDSPELEHNLEISRERTVDEFSHLPEPFWRPAFRAVVRRLGEVGLFAAGMFFYVLGAVVLALKIRSGPTPWRRRILAVSAAGAVACILLAFFVSFGGADEREGVVLLDEVTLMSEPAGSESDQKIHEGLVVDIAASRGEWLEVKLPNGATGWLRAESIGEI